MTSLSIQVKTTNEFIISETEWLKFMVTVTAKRRAVRNVTIAGSITNGLTGEFDEVSVLTDEYGFAELRFKASETGWFEIRITATKTGYTDDTFDISICSLDEPTEFYTPNKLYLNFLEERKKNFLFELREYLDNDQEFYGSTGAVGPITYLSEWNFQNKDFPLIVATSESPSFNFLGLSRIIDNSTFGGVVDVSFGLNAVCENKNILDRLTEKIIFILNLKHMVMYGKYGINMDLNNLATGALATSEYGAKLLYANKISIPCRIEMAYNISASDVIESIYSTGTTISL